MTSLRGAFVWTLSGTAGAAYSAVTRNLPAIAFSAGNTGQRSLHDLNVTTPSHQPDPAIIGARLSLNIIQGLINGTTPGERLLPLGYGLSVNWAAIDTLKPNATCVRPTFYQTRFTGGAVTDIAVRNATTGVFKYGSLSTEGINTCINGNCSLPGETEVVNAGCYGSVSVFTIDYTAPTGDEGTQIRAKLNGVAQSGAPDAVLQRRRLNRRTYDSSVQERHD